MQSLCRSLRGQFKSIQGYPIGGSGFGLGSLETNAFVAGKLSAASNVQQSNVGSRAYSMVVFPKCPSWQTKVGFHAESSTYHCIRWDHSPIHSNRCISTSGETEEECASEYNSASNPALRPRIKMKRLDKTAHNIMQILDREAVAEVRAQRDVVEDIRPGYIVQFKVEVPENKRRVSTVKGIVIARRNAGLNTTFRIRRLVAGVGVESLYHLYSPNIKELKVLNKKSVRRAKLYYLRDKMNALKKSTK